MEALTAASVALLTVWDSQSVQFPRCSLWLTRALRAVVKAVAGKEMTIEGLKVVRKSGGKSGDWMREDSEP